MTHVVLLNIVFFVPAMCGATAFALFVYRFLKSSAPPEMRPPGGGSKAPRPVAGPNDLARSA
jgi:hypothetical protein